MTQVKAFLGQPNPLGATWMGNGVNFAIFSEHATSVELCLFDSVEATEENVRIPVKEQTDQVWHVFLPDARPEPHNGKRVANGQRAMQLQSDPFLGWTQIGSRHFLVRQLNDHKGSIDMEDLTSDGLAAYGEVCGELLARGHARSGDPLVLAGYLGSGEGFAEALGKFGCCYADQTEKDWEDLRKSRKAGARARAA